MKIVSHSSCRTSAILKHLCPHVKLFLYYRANGEMKPDASEDESEEENEEGDYTVYECPGLAPVRFLSLSMIITKSRGHYVFRDKRGEGQRFFNC